MASLASEDTPRRPNVVLIMADDFGYECLQANGGQSYKTPHLDRIAAQGVRFEECHVQPLCTPTRVQLMTGLHNIRNYVNFGTLLRSQTTFAHLFQRAGYATAICGKWQLGREVDAPQHFGFQEAYLWQHTRRPPRYANPGLEKNGQELDFSKGEYGPKLLNDFAIDFVRRHRDQPFLLYYPLTLTHDPFQPTPDSPDWDPQAMGEKVHQDVKHFADMVAYMDRMVGQLDECLGELGVRDNTLLIFLGDNGTGRGVTSRFQQEEVKGGKGTTTRHGTHVPLLVQWPKRAPRGAVNRDLISSVDILPTICEAAGIPVSIPTDGVSFLPQVRGEKGQPREWLYHWYSPRQSGATAVTEFAFNHRYKLYRSGKFFDLQKDPLEKRALAIVELKGDAAKSATVLQTALDSFRDARPQSLEPQGTNAAETQGTAEKKKKNKKKAKKD